MSLFSSNKILSIFRIKRPLKDFFPSFGEVASGEGVTFEDKWFVGCSAVHVLCEGNSFQRYIGHANNLGTKWLLIVVVGYHQKLQLPKLLTNLYRQRGFVMIQPGNLHCG